MPSLRRLQQYAIAISVASIIWNGAEGGLSIGFGAETSSRSLVFFGIQSAIEVISAIIVVWRFIHVAKPGEEQGVCLTPRELKFEKYSTMAIGGLLIALSVATIASASAGLALHLEPDASTPALVISASALVIMIFIWLPKRTLAKALNSAALQGEAACSLACIQITLVLFVGALAFRLRRAAWWLDGATALVLALMFAAEGGKMLRWACNPAFDGGCCDHRGKGTTSAKTDVEAPPQYRDLCACCDEKEACKAAAACRCDGEGCGATTKGCCDLRDDGKCCTGELRTGVRPGMNATDADCVDDCCTPVTATCTKGCCSPSVTKAACTKGCCAPPSVTAATCTKGCCDPPPPPPPPASCTKGCCSPPAPPTAPASCTKGCCAPTKPITTPDSKSCNEKCCTDSEDGDAEKTDGCKDACCD